MAHSGYHGRPASSRREREGYHGRPAGSRREREGKKKEKPRFAGKLVEMLELPKEVVFNLPVIQALGDEDISVTNYKGLIEYTSECVRVATSSGQVRFEGSGLILRHVTSENITVSGRIEKIEFI